jgi:hypothetical protein
VTTWNASLYFALAQILVIKILLINSPSKFLELNTPKVKLLCTAIIFTPWVNLCVYLLIYGIKCHGAAYFSLIIKLDIELPDDIDILNINSDPIAFLVLITVFLVEVGFKIFSVFGKFRQKYFNAKVKPFDLQSSQFIPLSEVITVQEHRSIAPDNTLNVEDYNTSTPANNTLTVQNHSSITPAIISNVQDHCSSFPAIILNAQEQITSTPAIILNVQNYSSHSPSNTLTQQDPSTSTQANVLTEQDHSTSALASILNVQGHTISTLANTMTFEEPRTTRSALPTPNKFKHKNKSGKYFNSYNITLMKISSLMLQVCV